MTKKNKNGFTLVEILAVVVILGILLVIAMPSYTAVFNSLKRTAYLNKVKALNLAAKDYLSNTAVRDEVKNTTSSKPNWCKTIKVSELIKAGYILSESDTVNVIYDNYTGEKIGYNSLSDDDSYLALCYCTNDLKFESFLVKDLDKNMTYREGEIIRDPNSTLYVYYEVTTSFTYNEVADVVIRTLQKGDNKVSFSGIDLSFSSKFDEVTEYSLDNENFKKALGKVIFENFTKKNTCNL